MPSAGQQLNGFAGRSDDPVPAERQTRATQSASLVGDQVGHHPDGDIHQTRRPHGEQARSGRKRGSVSSSPRRLGHGETAGVVSLQQRRHTRVRSAGPPIRRRAAGLESPWSMPSPLRGLTQAAASPINIQFGPATPTPRAAHRQ